MNRPPTSGENRFTGPYSMNAMAAEIASSSAERRTFQRVRVKIFGRYMLPDRTEHPCQVIDMSPGSVSFRCDSRGQLGDRIVAYLDHVGRVEGVVTRLFDEGFALSLVASERKREKLAAQLTWLANKHELDLPEDRRHERIAPDNPVSVMQLADGRQYECRIIDLSLSGAAVETQVRPAIGVQVLLGTMRGQVVRHFDDGIAIEFAVLQDENSLHAQFRDKAN